MAVADVGRDSRVLSGIGEWGAVWFLIAIILFIREEERDHWFFAHLYFLLLWLDTL